MSDQVEEFTQAIDELEEAGFRVELFLGKTHWKLRWQRKGARWESKVTHFDLPVRTSMEILGWSALSWLKARERGDGNEEQFATEIRRRA